MVGHQIKFAFVELKQGTKVLTNNLFHELFNRNMNDAIIFIDSEVKRYSCPLYLCIFEGWPGLQTYVCWPWINLAK